MVSVNQQTCIGCGACAATCPKVFEIKDGKSNVKKGQEKSKLPCVKEATEGCPTNSIRV
ncbi:MAG: ferredoxin [Candidatus Nanoarchaeia archaeon]|nr:ferredoxin [Candidatus Nanoarchaeia archaeon]MDD5741615.1 ferredoxin [Candidatus Nanoarchaeia archaeon]